MRITPAARTLLLLCVPTLALTACLLPFHKRAHRSTDTQAATSSSSLQNELDELAKNPLFTKNGLIMRHQDCDFSDSDSQQDYIAEIKLYTKEETNCLTRAWGPVMSAAGFPHSAPALKFVLRYPFDTECANSVGPDNPTFTCPESIYVQLNDRVFKTDDGKMDIYAAFSNIEIAYTSWVEFQIGLIDEAQKAEGSAGQGTAGAGEIYRRRFLALTCLSGLYLGSQYKDDSESAEFFNYLYDNTDNYVADVNRVGTPRKPSGQHQLDWFRKGVDSGGHPSACNTWAAPASEVS